MQTKRSPRFGAKQEAEWQRKRWKASFLVRSRQQYEQEMKQRPWVFYFYKTILTSGTEDQSRMLDVGCGTGYFTRLFGRELIPARKISQIVGADLNGKLLQVAKKEELLRPKSRRRIEYVQADAYHLPFRSNQFGLITSRTVLMHLSSPIKALGEMTRICKKGGRVVSIEPDWGMFAIHNSANHQAEKEDSIVLQAEIAGRKKLYGQDVAIGRRLPDLFHNAGLSQFTIDSAFEGVSVPCDSRTRLDTLRRSYRLSLENLDDEDHVKEYTKVLIASGLSRNKVRDYLRRYRARVLRNIRLVRTKKSKDKITKFFASPFFIATGKKA